MSEQQPGGNPRRWPAIYEAMTGASAPINPHDHDLDPPGAKPEAVKAGHEPDRFDARGIVFVPILVVLTAAVAYAIVTTLFGQFKFGEADTDKTVVQNQQAADEAARPYNRRIEKISSMNPEAEVKEPRLEGVRNIDARRNNNAQDDPAYVRSFQTSDKDKILYVTPQDLYPDRFVDPVTGKKLLSEFEYANEKKTVARIPVSEAMKLVKLPAKKGSPNTSYNAQTPKLSNGGQANSETPPAKPADKKEEGKH